MMSQTKPLTPDSLPLTAVSSNVYIAGHRGMVGSAIVRLLKKQGYENIITRTSKELDLTSQQDVRQFFQKEKIDYVVLAAAKVGGIHANKTYPAEFIYKNLMIQSNVIHQAYESGVVGLLFLGSSCIYPKFAPQPMQEESLLTGILEPTNEPYAIAKIAGIKTCESYNRQYGTDYRSVMPTNLYGPGDSYHLENSHVIPAIIRKYHLARLAQDGNLAAIEKDEKIHGEIPEDIRQSLGLSPLSTESQVPSPVVQLWGTGNARREFLHVDDMASACYHIMTLDKATYDASLSSPPSPKSQSPDPSSPQSSVPSPNLLRPDPLTPNSSPLTPPCFLNIGTGKDCTIREVAEIIKGIVGFEGETKYNSDQPDGTPRKLQDTTRLTRLGWSPTFGLKEGLQDAYNWYCSRK